MAQLEMMEKDADFSLSLPNGWAHNWWLFMHNGLRLELLDMHRAMLGVQALDKKVTDEHLRSFFEWFRLFDELFSQHLEFEEQHVFPLIKSKINPRPKAFPSEDDHVHVGLKLTKIRLMEQVIGTKKPHKVGAELERLCTNFILLALENMRNEEANEAMLLQRYGREEDDVKRLNKAMHDFFGKNHAEINALASLWRKDLSIYEEQTKKSSSRGVGPGNPHNPLARLTSKMASKSAARTLDRRRSYLKQLHELGEVSQTNIQSPHVGDASSPSANITSPREI
eukprot:CAMPEP_0185844370 /NCGR_PEP_ID=MMETSP1354-20130828/558_1 /TAXON_ID=708628 /ORGANISM="Erythrolobus madagascarensis, Strain CCMP3276" /LENGTH=281 /DNA_ID=CAMNT_0028544023 /DNA_START=84 /DNA_END=929 /DNA_ORIENTATION=-